MCKAFGRHAGNAAIANGNNNILYFANAKVGLSNQLGALWLYVETHVAVVAPAQIIPVAKFLMELRAYVGYRGRKLLSTIVGHRVRMGNDRDFCDSKCVEPLSICNYSTCGC